MNEALNMTILHTMCMNTEREKFHLRGALNFQCSFDPVFRHTRAHSVSSFILNLL